MPILAVHISDGVLPTWPWVICGFALATLLIGVGCVRIRDDEVPMLALMSAAFFVGSLFHVRAGPVNVHLILNGLVGVLLGVRAGVAIGVGLVLQAFLFGHGGFSALGVNICVMTIPALIAGYAYRPLVRLGDRGSLCRFLLTAIAAALWMLTAIIGLLWMFRITNLTAPTGVGIAIGVCSAGIVVGWLERRLEHQPGFPIGLLLGAATVLLTVVFNAAVLAQVLPAESEPIAAAILLAHLPIAAVEGWIVGVILSFLLRAAPQLLPGVLALRRSERKHFVERDLPLAEPYAHER